MIKNNGHSNVLLTIIYAVVFSFLIFFVDTITPQGYLDWFFYLAVIFYAAVKLPKYYIIIFAAASIILNFSGFFLSPPGISTNFAVINRTIGELIIWMTATLLYYRNKDMESAAEIKQQLKIVIDKISSGVIYFNIDGEIKMINRNFADFLGYQPDELENKNIMELVHPDYRKEFLETKERIILGLLKRDFIEAIMIKKNGDVSLVNMSLNISQGVPNDSKTFIAFIYDSDLKEKEEVKTRDLIQEKELVMKELPY